MTDPLRSPPLQPSPALRDALRALPLLRLHFVHRMLGDLECEPFKGSLWHSLFGLCLHDLDEPAFAALMRADEQHRPWVLCPPLDTETIIPAGVEVEGCLTLLGAPAIAHADACVRALQAMGERGFGRARVPARLEGVWVDTAGREPAAAGASPHAASGGDGAVSAWDFWAQASADADEDAATGRVGLSLRLASPLRLKLQGDLLRDVPPLQLLMRRLLGRLVVLSAERDGGLFAPGEYLDLLRLAEAAPVLAHHLAGVRWERRSSRTGSSMPFEGLLGRVDYGAPASALLPWFALGEVLQLGSKVTFGMGVVRARVLR